jgi:hypothetical protein
MNLAHTRQLSLNLDVNVKCKFTPSPSRAKGFQFSGTFVWQFSTPHINSPSSTSGEKVPMKLCRLAACNPYLSLTALDFDKPQHTEDSTETTLLHLRVLVCDFWVKKFRNDMFILLRHPRCCSHDISKWITQVCRPWWCNRSLRRHVTSIAAAAACEPLTGSSKVAAVENAPFAVRLKFTGNF